MKILNVNAFLDTKTGGGTAERMFQMAYHLAKLENIQSLILTLDLGLSQQRRDDLADVEIVEVPCINKRFYLPSVFSIDVIKKTVKKCDVIHLMGHWTVINLIVCFYARIYEKPYIVCPAGALPIYGRSSLLKRFYNFIGGKSCIRNASHHIAISQDEYAHYMDYSVDRKKVLLVPNGIDPLLYSYVNNSEIRKIIGLGDAPFLLYVGRLNKIKGPDLLLDSFAKINAEYKDYHLVFAGPDDGMLALLKSRVAKQDFAPRVHFIGFIDGKMKSALYHAAELIVIPSRSEAMSIVVLEAAMAGKPVLMTDRCGLKVLAHGHGGTEVTADVEGLGNGLRKLLGDSNQLRVLGEKLHNYAIQHYRWGIIITMYHNIFKKALEDCSDSKNKY